MASWTIVLVRHASAGARRTWVGDDLLRPLDARGEAQAAVLEEELGAMAFTSIGTAPALRCKQTIAPLAASQSLAPVELGFVGEEGYWEDPDSAFAVWIDLASAGASRVICSQGGAIPDLMERSLQHWSMPAMDTWTKKGAYWLIRFEEHARSPASVELRRNRA